MGKSYYSDFVNHCLRFYCRYPDITDCDQADRANWSAAMKAVTALPTAQQPIITEVYSSKLTMNEAVCRAARVHGATLDEVWQMVKAVERKTAELRGLV